jgi:subtilase family serine protease
VNRRFLLLLIAAATLFAVSAPATAATASTTGTQTNGTQTNGTQPTAQAACGASRPGWAHCLALYRVPARAAVAGAEPSGYGPTDLRSAYDYPATGGANQTVAIVDAYDDPTAETDLAAYRSQYGQPTCSTANGCFAQVNQTGQTGPLPTPNAGWAVEISLDLDMVSAACPGCHILLVEADTPSMDDLAASVDTAVRLGATEVSNSYGGAEDAGPDVLSYRSHYKHPGVAIVASSGDLGFGTAQAPAVFASVIAVGGTSLVRADNARGWSETAWSGAGSGCSAWVAKPAWQTDPHCHMRTVADLSADADPDTGVAVYDTYQQPGWLVVGGTSASAPFVAGGIALAGNPSQLGNAARIYRHPGAFNDVVGGTAGGPSCGGDYLCNGVTGYDAPTGVGSPRGLGGL